MLTHISLVKFPTLHDARPPASLGPGKCADSRGGPPAWDLRRPRALRGIAGAARLRPLRAGPAAATAYPPSHRPCRNLRVMITRRFMPAGPAAATAYPPWHAPNDPPVALACNSVVKFLFTGGALPWESIVASELSQGERWGQNVANLPYCDMALEAFKKL